jgi:hypothetical protein
LEEYIYISGNSYLITEDIHHICHRDKNAKIIYEHCLCLFWKKIIYVISQIMPKNSLKLGTYWSPRKVSLLYLNDPGLDCGLIRIDYRADCIRCHRITSYIVIILWNSKFTYSSDTTDIRFAMRYWFLRLLALQNLNHTLKPNETHVMIGKSNNQSIISSTWSVADNLWLLENEIE